MSRHLDVHGTAHKALFAAIGLLALLLIASAIAAADHPTNEDANRGGSGMTEWTGEWLVTVGDDLSYANQTISLDGNLNISEGGRLVLRNVTLVLHGTELAAQEIAVYSGGELVVTDLDADPATTTDRSVVKSGAVDEEENVIRYYFQVFAGSKLTVTNSLVQDCGRQFNLYGFQAGLYLASTDATVEGVEFTKCFGGIFIDGLAITVKDCDIHDNEWIGIYANDNANVVIDGCSIEDNLREGVMVQESSDVTIISCSIRGNNRGIVADASTVYVHDTDISSSVDLDINLVYYSLAELYNCSISGTSTGNPVLLENSSLTSTNGTFDIGKVEMVSSTFRYQQFLTVGVFWADSVPTPIPDVSVRVEDNEGETFNYFTGDDGLAAYLPMMVVEYKMVGTTLQTVSHNPFHVFVHPVIQNLLEQDDYVDLRYDSAVKHFQYIDSVDPVAVDPGLRDADVGIPMTLDGSACSDNVAVGEWNWSYEELGLTVYASGEKAVVTFKQAKVYTITLKVTDTSGRSGPGSRVTFDVTVKDKSPPTADAGADAQVEQGTLVAFDGSASTDNVGVISWTWSFTYGGAPRSLTGATASYQFEIPGTYLVVLTVEDAAGYSATDSLSVVVVDTTPPTTTATLDPPPTADREYNQVVQVRFTISGEPTGQVELYYRINSGDWQKTAGGVGLSFGGSTQYPDGTYEIEYYAKDASGNTEETQKLPAFLVDATPPEITDLDPPITPFTVSKDAYTIKGRTEPGATLTINSITVEVAADGTFSHNVILEKGENSFFILAQDEVGNTDSVSLVIEYKKYGTTPGEDGGNAVAYIVGAVVAVVVLLLLIYLLVLRGKGKDQGPVE